MISKNPTDSTPQETSLQDAGTPAPDPRAAIEVASGGTGSTNDPGATDNKPPGVEDFELFV